MREERADDRVSTEPELQPAAGAITRIAAGLVDGWVSGPYGRRRLALFAGRHRVASTLPRAAGDEDRADFTFDARHIPPDLLAGAKLTFEVAPLGERTAAFASATIETSDFVKIEDLPAGSAAGSLEGCIDEQGERLVRGWVHDKARPERQLDLFAFDGERFIGKYLAAQSRPDLAASGRGHGCYGFEIHIRERRSTAFTVLAGDPDYWRVPLGAHAQGAAAAPARRRQNARELPGTVEQFARLLASAEPFPKKAFVLDKLKHGVVPDAFSADYVLLALEFLHQEMVATGEAMQGGWRERLRSWAEMRVIGTRIRRLEELAATLVEGPRLLESRAKRRTSDAA